MTDNGIEDQAFRRSPATLSADVGKDFVALNVEKGHCYGMENVAAEVWKLLEQPADIDQLCAHLVGRYDVEPETCRREIADLLRQFRREGLIEPA